MAGVMPPVRAVPSPVGADGAFWPPGHVAASESEVDGLFRQAAAFAMQQGRDRLQHAMAQSTLLGKKDAAEEKLQAAQLRNMELAQRVQLLEGALQRRRAKDAARLLSKQTRHSGRQPRVIPEALRDDPVADAVSDSELSEAELAHRRLRGYAAKLPRARKHRVRPNLCKMLRAADFEHAAASVFWEQVPEPDAGHLDAMGRGSIGSGEDALMLFNAFDAGEGLQEAVEGAPEQLMCSRIDSDGCQAEVLVLEDERSRVDHRDLSGGAPMENPGRSHRITSWQMQATLRGHLDGVRSVVCHRDFLFSAGEDTVVKAWDLSFLYQAQSEDGRHPGEDVEAYATYRGHGAAVLSLAVEPRPRRSGTDGAAAVGHLFSGGRDGDICVWQLRQPSELDPYDATPPGSSPNACIARLREHGDAVWSLALHPILDALASASADGTIRLWRTSITEAATSMGANSGAGGSSGPQTASSLQVTSAPTLSGGEPDRPSSIAWVPMRSELLLASFASARASVYNVERNSPLLAFDTGHISSSLDGPSPRAVTSVACHAELAVAVAGHADSCARMYCLGTGQVMQTLRDGDRNTRHAVTSVAFDPRGGFEVATTSHDGALRIFDIRKGQLIHAMLVHDRKFDEAAHCVFHAGTRLATGGADAGIRIIEGVEACYATE